MTAAETRNPTKNIPKAIRGVYIRILVFYIVGVFVSSSMGKLAFAEPLIPIRPPDPRSYLPK
jgi:L-asparagine transporter-like permease